MPDRPLIGITADLDSAGPRSPHSFLYTEYSDAVRRFGGLPVLLPPCDDADEVSALVERLDGVVFSGGDDMHPRHYGQALVPEITLLDPRRESFELALARVLLAADVPVLGVCNGIQLLNVADGGTLVPHLDPAGPDRLLHKVPRPARAFHEVTLDRGSRLAAMMGADRFVTNSFHHQSVADPGRRSRLVGHAADGVVEALELDDHPWAFAVQWHPEKMTDDPIQARLFESFIEAASVG